MNKIILADKIVVYRDVFKKNDIDTMIEMIKSSDDYESNSEMPDGFGENANSSGDHGQISDQQYYDRPINKWVSWYDFGIKSSFNNQEFKDINKKYFDLRDLINNNFKNIVDDYIKDWKDAEWAYYANSLNNLNQDGVEILKHKIEINKEYAIKMHTDNNPLRYGLPEWTQVITQLFYLNDNYEGGELDFILLEKNKLITYKPKAGDLVVMPSGYPHVHGARAVSSGESKLFLRRFNSYIQKGSNEYEEHVKKYGEEIARTMENYAASKAAIFGGPFIREIVTNLNKINSSVIRPFYSNKENSTYIDGKDI